MIGRFDELDRSENSLEELKVRLTLDNVSLKKEEAEDLQCLLDKAANPIDASTAKALEDMDKGGKLLVKMTKMVEKLNTHADSFEERYAKDLSLLSQLLAAIAKRQPVSEVKALLKQLEASAQVK